MNLEKICNEVVEDIENMSKQDFINDLSCVGVEFTQDDFATGCMDTTVTYGGEQYDIGFSERDGDVKFISKQEYYNLLSYIEGEIKTYKEVDPMTSEVLARIDELEDIEHLIKKL